MMRILNRVLVAAAAVAVVVLLVIMTRPQTREGVEIRGKEILVYGKGYTLERLHQVAQELGVPEVFTYDPRTREATANASIVVHGSLQIGDPADPKLGETLLLNTVVCGDLRFEVARGGELRIHNSTLMTVSQVITEEKCSRGYYFVTGGLLEAADSRILYMSGALGETASSRAQVDLERVAFALSDDCSFHARGVDGRRLDIRDSRFLCEGSYGFWVEDNGGGPVRLVRCRLFGTEADLYLSGRNPEAELIDCQFTPSKVRFQRSGGHARIRWTVTAKVLETGSGKPVPGVEVVATSTGKGPAETLSGRTAADGTCPLVLTAYVATADSPTGERVGDAVTPHRIVVRAADGRTLAEVASYEASGTAEFTLEVPATVAGSAP